MNYGSRFYDAVVARFWGRDALADSFVYVTPYNYAENEPVTHIDMWGMQKWPVMGYDPITEGMRFAGLKENDIQQINQVRAITSAAAFMISVSFLVSPVPTTKALIGGGIDFASQMVANKGDIEKWNITQTAVAAGLSVVNLKGGKQLFLYTGGAAISSALEVRPTETKFVFGKDHEKDLPTFFIQTFWGTIGNVVGGTSGEMKSVSEAVYKQVPNFLPSMSFNIFQNNMVKYLKDKNKQK